ncbi:hypothetical protein [Enterobacter sp. KBR-315C3_2022]
MTTPAGKKSILSQFPGQVCGRCGKSETRRSFT